MKIELRIGLSILIPLVLLAPCFAQQPNSKSTTTVVRRQKSPPLSSRNSGGAELKSTDKPPDMPGVTLPSQKFLYGYNRENKDGRNLGARFEVPEQASAVITYYQNSLKSSGWLLSEENVKSNTIVATNKQYKAALTVMTFKSAKSGCQVNFAYGVHN